jgi:hypothetical protein
MAWSIAGNIRGPAGATGADGATGATGSTGATGPQGNPTSVTAADATITIGGTSAAVTVGVNAIPESKVTGLTADLAAKVPTTRTVSSGTYLTGGGDLSADRIIDANVGTGSGTLAAGNDSRITGAVQASTVDAKGDLLAGTADNTIARLAVGSNGQFLVADSGATPGVKWSDGVAALTDGANIATDASAGEIFTVTLGGNRTFDAPTNARDGMRRTWRIRQDATGGRTITLASGTGGFVLGSLIPNVTPNTAANKVAYMTALYDSGYTGGARWCVLSFEPGV